MSGFETTSGQNAHGMRIQVHAGCARDLVTVFSIGSGFLWEHAGSAAPRAIVAIVGASRQRSAKRRQATSGKVRFFFISIGRRRLGMSASELGSVHVFFSYMSAEGAILWEI